MRYVDPVRRAQRSFAALALLLAACGGGGGGGEVIAPFWVQSGLVVADLNADGRTDVAVATTYVSGLPPHAGSVAVYLRTAAGSFAAPVRYPVGPDPWGLSAGDVDGDGGLDLVVATPHALPIQANTVSDSGGVAILRQDPARPGRFLGSSWLDTGGMAEDVATADFDGDGRADLVVADGVKVNGRALWLRQSPAGPGAFLAPVSLPVGSGRGSEDVAVGDVDGDGLPDVVLAAGSGVAVFHRRTAGGFASVSILAAGINAVGVAIGDLDGDGRPDIVAANAGNASAGGAGGASVTLLRQTSAGQFVATDIPVADGARRLAIGDLNADGRPDIAVVSLVYQAQSIPSRVSVLLQSPTARGQFAVAEVHDATYSGNFIAIADLNDDGRNDLVVNDGPGVLLQRHASPGTFGAVQPLR